MSRKTQVTIYYQKYKNGIMITGTRGRASYIKLPDTIEGLPVIALGDYALAVNNELPFADEETIGEVTLEEREGMLSSPSEQDLGEGIVHILLPDSIMRLGSHCFFGCKYLKHILLPDSITILPEYSFCGCSSLEELTLPRGLTELKGYCFHNCTSLKQLHLPESVKRIEKYGFYNCRSLKKINIPKNAEWLETGLFLNCDSLYDIHFGQCRHISDIISGLNHELLLTIDLPEERVRLFLPDFQYEYIEDTPARQFHQVNYGTGHLFRQCIGNREIDFRRYDELFYLTKREDEADFVLILAVCRLSSPYRLTEERKETYISYIREHISWAVRYFAEKNDIAAIRLFARLGLFAEANIGEIIDICQRLKKTEILSFLLDCRHSLIPAGKPKKTFDL